MTELNRIEMIEGTLESFKLILSRSTDMNVMKGIYKRIQELEQILTELTYEDMVTTDVFEIDLKKAA